jgi:hypothetical protein
MRQDNFCYGKRFGRYRDCSNFDRIGCDDDRRDSCRELSLEFKLGNEGGRT